MSLYLRVLCAVALGVLLGVVVPDFAVKLDILSKGFIQLVKTPIAPLVFCSIVVGIAGMKSLKSVGRTGGLAIGYFELMTTVALVIGLVVVNTVRPGDGMNIDPHKLDPSKVKDYAEKAKSTTDFILQSLPDSFAGAFMKGDLIPVLVLAALFGFALQGLGDTGKPILDLVDRFGKVIFRIIGMIMWLAPFGALGAMAHTVGEFGVATLWKLGALMLCFYATCLVFIFGVLGGVARLAGFSIFKFVRYIKSEIFLVFSTSSSESALSPLMTKLEGCGAGKSTVDLVVPTGYSLNLDGTAIYLTMAAVFIAQATNTPMSLLDQLELLGVLLLTSKGAAGVTGSGFVVLAGTLSTVGNVPVVALAIIVGIDRFMSEARALTNVIGNGVATMVVARVTGDLDEEKLATALAGGDTTRAP